MSSPGLKSIRADGDKLEIINQLLLPHTTEWIQINSIEEAHDAIKSMKVIVNFFQVAFTLIFDI